MKIKLGITCNDTLLFVLLGFFCFGGATGRLFLGLSIFDILLAILFIKSIINNPISKYTIFLFLVVGFGLVVTLFNVLLIDKGYSYFITELRYYLYLPLYYQIISVLKIDGVKINKYFRILLLLYTFIYLFLLVKNSFLFDFFNKQREINAYDFVGRISGPQIIFLSVLFFITIVINKKINLINTILYASLVMIVYIKTGERTVLLTNVLPLVWIVYEKRNIWMLSVIPILASIVPLYVNETQIKRFKNILNPLDDPAFVYRLKNIQVMLLEDMPMYFHSFITGYGFGSNYSVFVLSHPVRSYFLDNSFVMLVYKLGIPIALVLLLFIYSRSWHLSYSTKIYLLIFITIPALTSYHLILQPAYLLSYFFAIRAINLDKWK